MNTETEKKTEKTWAFIDKSDWGDGEWQSEADKYQYIDAETNLPCLIVRTSSGHLCGYVGVTPDHPFFGIDYEKIEMCLKVHGGITFTGSCQEQDKPYGICYIPDPGQKDEVWWIGFDTAHYGDLSPSMVAVDNLIFQNIFEKYTYKNAEYVKSQNNLLAAQLQASQSNNTCNRT